MGAQVFGLLTGRAAAWARREGLALSFNGGKDSTVILHLLRVALHLEGFRAEDAGATGGEGTTGDAGVGVEVTAGGALPPGEQLGITVFYFESQSEFPDIEAFVRETDRRFGLGLRRLQGSFQARLEELVAGSVGAPPMQGVVLGTRIGDPNAPDQSFFCPSSDGWPPFMRVNPVLDWDYAAVWDFLHTAGVPYSQLYDDGYTSLGSVNNTERNALLRREDGSYAPAHMLTDGAFERAGRAGGPGAGAGPTALGGVVIVLGQQESPPGEGLHGDPWEEAGVPELLQAAREAGRRVVRVVTVSGKVAAQAELRRARAEGETVVLAGSSWLDAGQAGGAALRPDGVVVAAAGTAAGAPALRAGLARALAREK